MASHSGNITKIGNKLGLTNEKGYLVAIFIALIVVSATVAGYYFYSQSLLKTDGYSRISLLDSEKKAIGYPEVLVANQNNTFNVWITVENHMGSTQDYQVLIKITQEPLSFPVDTQASKVFEVSNLEDKKSWDDLATVTLNEIGSYSVVFELWEYKGETLEFTYNYNVLNVQVISQ